MTVIVLNIKAGAAGSVRSVASQVTSESVQKLLALFSGRPVFVKVYSPTNLCFNVTSEQIDKAYAELDKKKVYWISPDDIIRLKEKFTVKSEYGHTLACSLPNWLCAETPTEIAQLVEQKKVEIEKTFLTFE